MERHKTTEKDYLINMKIALTKLSPNINILMGETINRFGLDHSDPEKRGRYFLSERGDSVVLVQETTTDQPMVRGVEICHGKIIKIFGFCQGLKEEEQKAKAAELFMGFCTCRQFFTIDKH